MRRITRWYGANPLHLLTLLACFALAGYAAAQLVPSRPLGVAVWFIAAVIGHDLVLMPLYSIADRSVLAAVRHRAPDAARQSRGSTTCGCLPGCRPCCCSYGSRSSSG